MHKHVQEALKILECLGMPRAQRNERSALCLLALLPSSGKKHRAAKIICDPDVIHSLDFSKIDAEVLLILPDNGHRLRGDQKVPKGSYLVTHS